MVHPLLKEMLATRSHRKMLRVALATGYNLTVAVFKTICAWVIPSFWFGINAIFLWVLTIVKFFSLREYTTRQIHSDKQITSDQKNYMRGGVLLMLLGIAYFFVSLYLYYNGGHTTMPKVITWLVAAEAFWEIGHGIYVFIKHRKEHTSYIRVLETTNFAKALTAIVLTQVALLETYAINTNPATINHANGLTGIVVSLVIMGLGLMTALKTKTEK